MEVITQSKDIFDTDGTLAVLNKKGGVGKSTISFETAFNLHMKVQTNDKSALIGCYKENTKLTNKLTFEKNTLYDLGGFTDAGVLNIIKRVDLVIIPVFNDPSALIQTKDTLKEILPIAKKVIIVATKTKQKKDKNKDFEDIKKSIDKKYPNLTYFNLPLTEAFNHAIRKGKSFKQLVETNPTYDNWFGDFCRNNYEPFLNYIKKEIVV